ncbi:MAG: glycosyltransferase family 39 protein, partial [Nanoarchaeota archaeon]|nr:glycosyltransferase family 39 protein [Nanoarchaeota archaeon]
MEQKESDFQVYLSKFKKFYNENFHLFLFAVLAIAAIIRFKYMTVNAAVWWDEADYLNIAKHYALGTPNLAAPWRARAMSILWIPLYKLGATEWAIRFLHQILSLLGVYLTYVVGRKFFNKNVGLIAAFMMGSFWLHIFWSTRIELGLEGMVIWLLSALFFWKGYVEKKNYWYVIGSAALMSWGLFAYEAEGFLIPFFGVFLLVTERLKFLKSKRFWLFVVTALIVATPFLCWNYIEFNERFSNHTPVKSVIFSLYPRFGRTYEADWVGTEEYKPSIDRPFSETINKFSTFFVNLPNVVKWPFFIFIIAGLVYFIKLFLGFDLLLKNKSKRLKKDFFILWWAVFVSLIFAIWMAASGFGFEIRLWFPGFPAIFIIGALGVVYLYNKIKKHSEVLAFCIIGGLLIFGAYANITHAQEMINVKKDSYSHIKLAGEWVKANSNKDDVLTGCGLSVPWVYYSERQFIGRIKDKPNLTNNIIKEHKPKYFIMDFYDPACQPQQYLQEHQGNLVPVNAYYFDEQKQQPIIVIFEIKYP